MNGTRWISALLLSVAFWATAAEPPAPAPAAPSTTTPAPAPTPVHLRVVQSSASPAITAALDEALNTHGLTHADIGFIAVDADTGKVIAESNADTLINPASNAKIITSATAFDLLKPEYRFKTEYYTRGQLKDGTLYGDLIVKGFGDPSVVSERLMKVANELYLFGVEKITGNVVVDDSWFDEQQNARGWEQEDAPDRAYAAPVNALMVNFNAIAVYVRPGESVGKPAIVRVDPPAQRVTLQGDVITGRVSRGIKILGDKHETVPGRTDGTLLTIEGTIGIREAPIRLNRRVWQPAEHFGSVLTHFLQQRGVKMRHSVVHATVPDGARLIYIDRSPRLKQIIDDLNHFSNNIIAETLIKQIGAETAGQPGTFEAGLVACRAYLEKKVGLAPGSYVFANGSGLNDVNRFSARQMARIVSAVTLDYEIGTEFSTSLAVAGTQGTIGSRMRDTPVVRRLRAKTGTLFGVSALSGTVVEPDGNVVVFSLLMQGLREGGRPAHDAQTFIGNTFATGGAWRKKSESNDDGDAVSQKSSEASDALPGG
jgi:serine-type D-Ala-D-Ala carboxypeptidase/endopeptidase (penicillin-binding protein 4)